MSDSKSLLLLFNQFIEKQTFRAGPQNLYEPVRYILGIGGKRIRPLLTLMAAELFEGNPSEVLPGAFAIEMFHNFSLVHDDIMDEAPLRRGKPSVHIKFGLSTGILSGDVMLAKVYEYLLQLSTHREFAQLLEYFNQAAIAVCEGQQLDVDFETMETVEEVLYLEMIEKKTAALLGAALAIGALPFGDKGAVVDLIEFGRSLGIAFQLKDDLLDTFGDTFKVGKQKGGDILQNKKTILTIQALQAAKEEDQELLADWMTKGQENGEQKIAEVSAIYIRSGAKSYAEQKIDFYQQQAMEALDRINVAEQRKEPLRELAQALMYRES